jgi:hypothetical protein
MENPSMKKRFGNSFLISVVDYIAFMNQAIFILMSRPQIFFMMVKISDLETLIQIGKFQPGRESVGPYVSPEILNYTNPESSLIGPSSDIFRFSVVILEIASSYFAPW